MPVEQERCRRLSEQVSCPKIGQVARSESRDEHGRPVAVELLSLL